MNGASIEDIQIAYNLAGDLNEYGDNLEKNLKNVFDSNPHPLNCDS